VPHVDFMQLDSLTLIVIGGLTVALCGMFLLAAWTHMRRETALLWWAAASFAQPASTFVAMVGVLTYDDHTLVVGLMIANVAPILIWGGARQFAAGKVPLPLMTAGAGLIALVTIGVFTIGGNVAAAMFNFVVWIVLLAAAAAELWSGRWDERLSGRWPLMALFGIHGLIYVGGLYDFLTGTLHAGIEAPRMNSWFGLSYFETILYSMGSAFFMTLLCKEREENRYILAARNDSLTGVANRGTFLDQAERLLNRCRADNAPLSLIVFDLDHFKSINDAYGHAAGDRVLRAFADTVREVLRPNDVFGRHGGEEFAIALPRATSDVAFVVAERVRNAFAATAGNLDGLTVQATVSAGVADAEPGWTFEKTMHAADMAMYRAKQLGRDRVERADQPPADDTDTDAGPPETGVMRVA
jgi:diguanylate cyclase (GGDEF)-like protein